MSKKRDKKAVIIGNGNTDLLTNGKIDISNFEYCLILDSAIINFYNSNINKIPDALLGDFDRDFDQNHWKNIYTNIEIIHAPDQEKTDFEKGIEYLIEQDFTYILGLGLTGKRMDHTFNNISSLAKYNHKIAIEILDEYSTIYCIDDSKNFEKLLDKNTIISLLPIGKVEGITTQNLDYNLTNENLELGIRTGSSNMVTSTNLVTISISKGKLIIMECHD